MEDRKGTRNLVKCQGHKSLIQLHNFFVSIVNSCLSEYVGSCIKWPVLLHVMKQYFNTKVKLMPRATFEGCCKIGQTFASSPYYSGPQEPSGGGQGVTCSPSQFLVNQLTLSQPGEAHYARHITTCHPGFSDLATALRLN